MLDDILSKHGYPVPEAEVPQTYEAWDARARLAVGLVPDAKERDRLLSLAMRHLARHRGWRNPWWSFDRLAEAPSPSEQLQGTLTVAVERFGDVAQRAQHLGELVSRVARTGAPIRPTKNAQANPIGALMATQVRQEDSLAELTAILLMQGVAEPVMDELCRAIFFQAKPHIPKDRIGCCALNRDQLRAPLATLEFQEFRVRAAVANLRIGKGSAKRSLTTEEHDRVVDYLLTWRDDVRPRWRDVAELLGVGPRELVDSSLDGSGATYAPHDRTSATVEGKFKASSTIGAWWSQASHAQRAELINVVTDLSGEDGEVEHDSVAGLLSRDDVIEPLNKLNEGLESGRAAYSQQTLSRLNRVMREERCDLHEARKREFQVDDSWQPPSPSFDDPIEHPTVSRVNALVRRYLITATSKWGMPDQIVVEHVRDAFAGPTGLAEIKAEIRMNTNRRERTAQSLREQGVQDPNRSSIRRNECVERQNCICLYCGDTITLLTCELDHIVPRSGGGSSRMDNLVAVCRACNSAKGKFPFAIWASQSPNPQVNVELAQQRVRDWQKLGMTLKTFARLKGDVVRRLALTADEELDERSLESTAYAAREMRARIETFLDRLASNQGIARGKVLVFGGHVTSEARKAGSIDDRIQLRSFTRKSRFDRRHHAVDAAVLTTLGLGVAKTLKERSVLRRDNELTGKDPGWKDYRGAQPADQATFAEWRERMKVLGGLLKDAIDSDEIPVVRPLRLAPRFGSVHADTIEKLEQRDLTAAFTQSDILRIVDRALFQAMSDLAEGADLDPDAERAKIVRWENQRPVELFPSNAAYLAVRGGAVAIGGSAKYAQVYAWQTKTGFNFGMVRLFAGEFAKIGYGGPGNDFLTTTPPAHSQAMRTCNPVLRKRIAVGQARLIGWLAIDDEIEIDPQSFPRDESKIGAFLTALPERRWTLTGFMNGVQVSIAPAVLALEGVVNEEEATQAGRGESPTPPAVAEVLKANRIPLSVNVVLGAAGTVVVRRTVLGRPRWAGHALPSSWKPREAAERAFRA